MRGLDGGGRRSLLPAVRRAAPSTLLVADGFSCREQVRQATDRRPLHLAEVLDLARRGLPAAPPGVRPEDAYRDAVAPAPRTGAPVVRGLLALGAIVVAALLLRRGGRARPPRAPGVSLG